MTMDDLRRLNGLFAGSLNDEQLRGFDEACADGRAYRSYEGVGGFLGLATVRIAEPSALLKAEDARVKEDGVERE